MIKMHNIYPWNCVTVKIVDDIMEQRTGKFNDEYRYLDPKILRGGDSIPRQIFGLILQLIKLNTILYFTVKICNMISLYYNKANCL